MTDKQTKEIKQYKEFTTVTNIRKLTQQAINPVIKSIQTQMNQLLIQNQQIRKDLTKIDQIYKQQIDITNLIDKNYKSFQQYKDYQSQLKRESQKKSNRLENANQKLFLEMQALKNMIKKQDQNIEIINNRNQKMSAIYSTLDMRNEMSIKSMQDKYNTFTRDVIKETKIIKQHYKKTESEINVVNETFKRERNIMEEKYKAIELFFQERDSMHQKFEDIYDKMIEKVTRQEFDGFRKSQAKFLQEKMTQLDQQILELIPMSLREVLPQIEQRLRKTDLIEPLQEQSDKLSIKIIKISETLNKTKLELEEKFKQSQKTISSEVNRLDQSLLDEVGVMGGDLQKVRKYLLNEICQTKITIEEDFVRKIEKETSALHRTISSEMKVKNIVMADNRDEELQNEVDQIRKIKQDLLDRSNVIEELGKCVDRKLESFGNRITKVRSDYELFADGIRKQVSLVVRFRQRIRGNLSDIGAVLSTISECLLISGSMHFETLMSSSHQKINQKISDHQVFVTNNDGIIYQYKGQNKIYKMQYRKQKIDPKQFIKSYMYSMTTYFDEIFEKYEFLDWKNQKPSAFFFERCFDNYMVRIAKLNESKTIKSNNFCGTIDVSQDLENDEIEFGGYEYSGSRNLTKAFSRTIQSRIGGVAARNDKTLNLEEKTNQLKKSYSIKKPRSTLDKNHHEQQFLSSRTGCRSRISQAN